ncbi:alpha/beta fold hydrolase [Microbacterium sp. 179-B 1A2 NHS]|uniref:alpha/beta fold hydrolase n=1 Tax=Microbacterium sp. 179-B 1A2 NHS TaxID=3142383 RepID=UPI0039A2BFEC
MVLVHGIGMSSRYFRNLSRRLRGHRRVVCVDLPGHGGLRRPGRDVDVAAMARGLAVVLERTDAAGCVVVGHSMGAQWVVETALIAPDLVARVVAIGPVTDDAHRTVPAQAAALAMDSLREPPRVNAVVFSDYVRCGIRWYLTQLRHMMAYPLEGRVARLSQPLLVLRGARDPIAGTRWCRALAASARDGRFVEIPGAAHVAQATRTDAVAAQLLALVPAER